MDANGVTRSGVVMTRDEFDTLLPLKVPGVIATCPICDYPIHIDGVDEWYEEDGQMRLDLEMGVSLDCGTAPDIDDPEWPDWHNGHWSMPYVDWLPVQQKVTRWLAEELVKPDMRELTAEQEYISNLRLYARLFEERQWETPQLHWSVFVATLNEAASTLEAKEQQLQHAEREIRELTAKAEKQYDHAKELERQLQAAREALKPASSCDCFTCTSMPRILAALNSTCEACSGTRKIRVIADGVDAGLVDCPTCAALNGGGG